MIRTRRAASVAEHLRRVTGGPVPWPAIDAAKALPWAEARTGLTLADSQAAAVRLALRSKATVITGGPGVGKTRPFRGPCAAAPTRRPLR